jgi:hypothetical protein
MSTDHGMKAKADGTLTVRVELTIRVDRAAWHAEYGTEDEDALIRYQIRQMTKEATEVAVRHLPVDVGIHGM